MVRYERHEYRKYGKEILLTVALVIGLTFVVYVSAHMLEVSETFRHFGDKKAEPAPTPEPAPVPESASAVAPAVAVDSNQTEKAEIARIDTDGDGMSDWFEGNYSHTDPKVANERYLLHVNAYEQPYWTDSQKAVSNAMIDIFIRAYKFKPENVFRMGVNATVTDFEKAVAEIAKKAGENDFVYVQIMSHGIGPTREYEVAREAVVNNTNKTYPIGYIMKKERKRVLPAMGLDRGVTYKEIGETLNKIKSKKMVVSYISCAGITAIEPLNETLNKDPNYPRVIMGWADIITGIGRDYELGNNKISIGEIYPTLKDNYLSVKDYFHYDEDYYSDEKYQEELAKINESIEKGIILDQSKGDMPFIEDLRIEMADPYDISGDFYFGEARTEELYQP